MTTLPQTTPIRLPRVAGQSQLSVPSGGHTATAAAPGMQMTPNDVWRVIRENLWLIVLLLVVSGVGGYFLNDYLVKHYARYSTSGLIRIRAVQSADPLRGTTAIDGGLLEIEQRTLTAIIRSDSLLDDVLMEADSPLRQTTWWKVLCNGDPQVAHQKLGEQLAVEPEPGSELIRVSVTEPIRADAPVLVSSIVDRAILKQKQNNRDRNDADRKRITDLRERNQVQLRRAQSEVRELADMLTRDGGDTRGIISSKDVELSHEVERNITLQNEKVTADNSYNAVKGQLDRGEIPGKIQSMVDADHDVQQYRTAVDEIDMAIALQADQVGSNNPAMQQLTKRRELYENKLKNTRDEKVAQFSRSILDELTTSRTTTAQLLDISNGQVASLKQSIADLGNKYSQWTTDREEEANDRQQDNEYKKAIQDLDVQTQAADFGSLAWEAHPLEPTSPSFPQLPKIMLGCVGAGLMLSLGIAFLRELADTTVRSPRDITRIGQMSLLGMVPHEADDPQSSGARLPLVIFEAPQSIMAEQLRQVRTRLQHAASLDTTRSILVTSPGPGDGKTTMAVNLAAGLALNGRRILLIDANFRRPELHRVFGIGNEVGFSDVLNDVNAFASAVRETTVPNLSVMPSGTKPGNSTELLESQLLLDSIERALEEYDHVIFDSGPMLFVSESVALAPRVDGVVTVVRARSSSRGVLTRMRDGLRAVKAEHLGVILNGVRSQAGGYYGRSIKTYYEYQNQA